jgi:thioredoxin reductase (NADPH)
MALGDDALDCLIIGAGPAGLTTAVYLGRFGRLALVADAGPGRATWIPTSHNLPGFAEGVSGTQFLRALRDQAERFGAEVAEGPVTDLRQDGEDFFVAELGERRIRARTVVLATGVEEKTPQVDDWVMRVRQGALRICPICDGYESRGLNLCVFGEGDHAGREALFLRAYTPHLTLALKADGPPLSEAVRTKVEDRGVRVAQAPADGLSFQGEAVFLALEGSPEPERFDAVYCAFGVAPQTSLARSLGARLDDDGRLYVTAHQETSVPRLFAAGDVVRGLNQISVAAGEAAVAATRIHNVLAPILAGV